MVKKLIKKIKTLRPKGQKESESGILGLFTDTDQFLGAVKKVRNLGVKKFETFAPFPLHGLEKAMGLKRSRIPLVTLIMGLTGWCLLFYFQYWTMGVSWPVNVGGKPYFSWPAYIPISFEGMVLIGGISTVVALFVTCRIPQYSAPVLDPRLTNDHFGVFIDKSDSAFDEKRLNEIFKEHDVKEIKQIS